MRIPLMIAASIALTGCPKKEEPQPLYKAPEIEWPDDDDEFDDLPEAGEEDTGETL